MDLIRVYPRNPSLTRRAEPDPIGRIGAGGDEVRQVVAIEIADADTRRGFAFIFQKKDAIERAQLRDRREGTSDH